MYSSDSDYLYQDSDNEDVAPLNSKTTMAPPLVCSFEELQTFKGSVAEAIICGIDFETVDNHNGTDLAKMSEIGIAVHDPRNSSFPTIQATSTSSTSNTVLEDLAKSTTAVHLLAEEWKHETETTCQAFWHRDRKKKAGNPHKARPYHCRFARSTILGRDQSIEKLKDILKGLTTQNLTDKDCENGEERQVRILFWDSGLEDKISRQAGISLPELGNDIQAWDLQAWSPFRIRFNNGSNNGQAKGDIAFASLGVLGATDNEGKLSTVLHNATNDTVAQLLAFLRITVMKRGEWTAWIEDKIDLAPISFDRVEPSIYDHNFSRRPDAGRQRINQWGQGKHRKHEKRPQHGSFRNDKELSNDHNGTSTRGPRDSHTTTACKNQTQQFCQQRTTVLHKTLAPAPEDSNTVSASTQMNNLTKDINNVQLQPSNAQTVMDGKEESQGPEKQEAQSSAKHGGRSRKQRQRKNKAAKREESSRQIPGLS